MQCNKYEGHCTKQWIKMLGEWDCNDTIFVVLVAINGGDSNA